MAWLGPGLHRQQLADTLQPIQQESVQPPHQPPMAFVNVAVEYKAEGTGKRNKRSRGVCHGLWLVHLEKLILNLPDCLPS